MIVWVQNNTKPDPVFVLRRGGIAVNLTGATVTFRLRKPSGAVLAKGMVIQGDPTKGKVSASWGVGDLDEYGEHQGEVVVDFGSGAVQNGKYPLAIYVRQSFEVLD